MPQMPDPKTLPLDFKIELYKNHLPPDVRDALVWVNDTMGLALASARQTFGEEANVETAIAIYDRVCVRLKEDAESAAAEEAAAEEAAAAAEEVAGG